MMSLSFRQNDWTVLAFSSRVSTKSVGARTPWIITRRSTPVENDTSRDEPLVEYDDLQRYRNRAMLLERIFQQKMKEYRLAERKLLVLQDTVQKLVRKHEKEQTAAIESERMTAQTKLQDFREAANVLQQAAVNKTKEELENKLENAKLAQVGTLKALQQQWDEKESKMAKQKNELWNDYQTLKDQYDEEKKQWEQDARQKALFQAQLAREQKSVEDKRNRIQELEHTLGQTKAKIQSVKADSRKEIEKLHEALEKSRQKVETMKSKWEALADSKRHLQSELEITQAKLQSSMETGLASTSDPAQQRINEESDAMAQSNTEMEQQLEESILVAQAAVAAAERREANLAKERTVLLQKLQVHKQEKESLLHRIARLEKQLLDQEMTMNTMKTASTTESDKSQPVEIHPNTQPLQELGSRRVVLQSKVKSFAKALLPGRMGNYVKQRVQSIKTLRPFIQQWIDRIPFRIVRKN
jgi:chromosome segregation ATPase